MTRRGLMSHWRLTLNTATSQRPPRHRHLLSSLLLETSKPALEQRSRLIATCMVMEVRLYLDQATLGFWTAYWELKRCSAVSVRYSRSWRLATPALRNFAKWGAINKSVHQYATPNYYYKICKEHKFKRARVRGANRIQSTHTLSFSSITVS